MAKFIDLTGRKFGRLTVDSLNRIWRNGARWNCVCDCGQTITVRGGDLLRGYIKSCGCFRRDVLKRQAEEGKKKLIDLTGKKFGKLTVLSRAGMKGAYHTWLCECECGKRIVVIGNNIRNGLTQSCGCTRRGKREISTGVSMVRLRGIWRAMIGRCEHPQHPAYKNYGARGVRVCDDWKYEKAFIAWALATGYNDSLTLDRVNNDGSYAPDNCKWASMKSQGRNRRNNVRYSGKTLPEWSEISGIKITTLSARIKRGLTIEQAIKKVMW